tara:strand:+ start:527 stop:763 length:237 start_codon:yes stop_codon:yes gene_type:complete
MDNYSVTFNFKKDLDKSIKVHKKSKTIDKVFFIPKSIIISQEIYSQDKSLYKDVKYARERICLVLPKWYCRKELGFYK